MRRNVLFALAFTSCVLLAACGGGSMTQPPPASTVPMSISIGDTPPSGVAILFFEALITGASLQPSDKTKAAVSVLSSPVEVEFGHLQTDTAFLNLASIPPDTYNSITLTFGTATMTIVNHSGAAVGTCANNTVCELNPSFNPSTATVSSAPFPVTIAQDSVVGLRLDFNVDSSVQTDLSINPVVTIQHLTVRRHEDEDEEIEEIDEIDGQVTNVGNNQFTLMNERSGQSFTISVDSNTRFDDFGDSGCTAQPANFTCIKTGQFLSVTLSENGVGSMLAKRVEFEENENNAAIKGTITSVDSATQFHIVVFNEEPPVSGVTEGSSVVVSLQPGAIFRIGQEELGEDGGFSVAGFSFAVPADLLVGQDVQIRPGTVTSSGGVTTIATNVVRLRTSQISGQVGAIENMPTVTFTLTGLSPLFTGATPPVTTINVLTLSEVDFMDFLGTSSPTVGSKISVRGLLFNTSGTPTLVTRAIREDNND